MDSTTAYIIAKKNKSIPLLIEGELEGYSVTLTANFPYGNVDFAWYRDNELIQDGPSNILNAPSSGRYRVRAYGLHRAMSDTVLVNVIPNIKGVVNDGIRVVHGAKVNVLESAEENNTDKTGEFELSSVGDNLTLEVTHPAYDNLQVSNINAPENQTTTVNPSPIRSQTRFNGANQSNITFDDVIRCLRQVTESKDDISSIFETPIFAFFKKMHDEHNAIVDLALFYEEDNFGFFLHDMTDKFKQEFIDNSHWMRFSFHSYSFSTRYTGSQVRDAHDDYVMTRDQVLRFAGVQSWIPDTYIGHFYSGRKHEIIKLRNEGVKILDGSPNEIPELRAYHYNDEQSQIWKDKGYFYDKELDLIVIGRTSVERRLGLWISSGGLDPEENYDTRGMEQYFDDFINPVPGFYHIETHEQRLFTPSSIYVQGILDSVKWMNENGFPAKFKDQSEWQFAT